MEACEQPWISATDRSTDHSIGPVSQSALPSSTSQISITPSHLAGCKALPTTVSRGQPTALIHSCTSTHTLPQNECAGRLLLQQLGVSRVSQGQGAAGKAKLAGGCHWHVSRAHSTTQFASTAVCATPLGVPPAAHLTRHSLLSASEAANRCVEIHLAELLRHSASDLVL